MYLLYRDSAIVNERYANIRTPVCFTLLYRAAKSTVCVKGTEINFRLLFDYYNQQMLLNEYNPGVIFYR